MYKRFINSIIIIIIIIIIIEFYQELEIKLKPREMVIFLCLKRIITHK